MARPAQLDADGFRKFGMRDKLAYAAGDFGCNMSFALKAYITVFWTQYMGVDAFVMSGLLLLVQIWDAINDPLLGCMIDADTRQYRRGKFLTYIWVGSLGLLAGGAVCFLPLPQMPAMAKNILFVAGYVLWDAFYTTVNVPYGSMLALISRDTGDRAELSAYRSVGAMIGGMGSGILLPMLIYDAGSNLRGDILFWLALGMGFLGFLAFQFMIRNTEIRVTADLPPSGEQPGYNPIAALGNFMGSRPAVGATLASAGTFFGLFGASTASTVMWQAYFRNAQISGMMTMLGQLPMFLFMPFIRKIVDRWGKKEAAAVGSVVALAGYILMLVLPMPANSAGIWTFAACQLIAGMGNGIISCVSFALMADAIDYNEWKSGVRDEGTTYAMYSFFRKLAQSLAPSIGLAAAAVLGYDANLGAAQSTQTALAMRCLTIGFYLFAGVLSFVGLVLIYNLDKKTLDKMHIELAGRKAVQT